MTIPAIEELKQYPQWVCWTIEKRQQADGTLKDTKVPKNPHTAGNAMSNNPDTWGSYQQAKTAYKQYNHKGLGFVFTKESGIVGIDLDKCLENNCIQTWAGDIIEQTDTYTEYSPSLSGFHLLAKGTIPGAIKKNKAGFEMYHEGRFFTITGKHLQGTPLTIHNNQDALLELYERFCTKVVNSQTKINQLPNTPDVKRIEEALKYIPQYQDYNDWLSVLMAIHSVYPNGTGISLIESWSPGYEGEVEEKFTSFKNNGITIATLFKQAIDGGYQPEFETKFNIGDFVSVVMAGTVKTTGKVTAVKWLPPEGNEWLPYYTIGNRTTLYHESHLQAGKVIAQSPYERAASIYRQQRQLAIG